MWSLYCLFWKPFCSSLKVISILAIWFALNPRNFTSSAPVEITDDFTASQMESFLANTKVKIYDQEISLQALYGDVQPTLENFITNKNVFQRLAADTLRICPSPPEFWTDCLGQTYVDRKLTSDVPSTSSTDSEDTPTQIAHDMSSYVLNQRESIPITTIIGEPGTGRTTSLLMIQQELINLIPSCWCIKIDSLWRELMRSDANYPDTVIRRLLNWDVRQLFRNLLDVNPKRIIFILDNVDMIAVEIMPLFVNFLEHFAQKGVVIVTAGRKYNMDIFNGLAFGLITYRIPELQNVEAKEILYNIWLSKNQFSHLNNDDQHAARAHLNDYSTVFTHVLYKTPIPRQPHMLNKVASLLSTRESSSRMRFPTDYAGYSLAPNPPLGRLRQALEANSHKQYYFGSKKELYEHLFTTDSHRRLTTTIQNYGSIAVHQLITQNEDALTANSLLQPILADANYAKLALPHFRGENKFFTIIDGVVEFAHPEYERYVAMDYITTSLISELDSPNMMKLVLQFFINPRYKYLLEFATGEDWSPLIDRIDNDSNLFRLLDNVIGNGLDHLYNNIHERLIHNNQADRLQRYFLEDRVIPFGPHRAFGMLQTGRPNVVINPATEFIPDSSPIGALFRYDMAHARSELYSSQIELNKNVNSHRLLYIAATNPWPNLEMCMVAMQYINYSGRITAVDLNTILYDVINQVGPGSEEIAIYLLVLGAKSTYIDDHGQSLLHAAVRWSDAAFLKFVIEVLPVDPVEKFDNLGRTVFAEALDANPTPAFTRPNWWQMMQYLVSTVNGLSLPPANLIVHNTDVFDIPVLDTESPWLTLMVGWRRLSLPTAHGNSRYNAHGIHVTSVSQPDRWFQYCRTLARAVPSHFWRLSPRTAKLRLNFLLHSLYSETDSLSPVEVLINYAGPTALSNSEHQYYRNAVNELYLRSTGQMSIASYTRIFVALVNNAIGGNDMNSLIYAQTNPMLRSLPQPVQTPLYDAIRIRFNSAEISNPQDNLLQRPLHWALNSLRNVDIDGAAVINNVLQYARLPALPHFVIQDSSQDPAICLPRRSRRSIAPPQICLYGWNDVDQFISNANRPALSDVRIDTDRFIAKLAATESSDIGKGRQLLNLVHYLENRAAPASILTGNSKLLVQDVLKHGSLMNYRRYQQTVSIINDNWRYSPMVSVKIPSQTVALYAVTGLALVRSAFATMNACSEPSNNSTCLFASSALAVSALQIPANYLIAKYMPWIVDRFTVTALELLPSRAPAFFRENLQLMRTTAGLRIAGRAVGIAIGLPGLGFELYTLVQLSTMVEHCSQEASNCTSRDRYESIIMLTFSCTSLLVGVFMLMATGLGIWIGLAVGFAIEIFQAISLGINDVIYYQQRYGTRFEENIRLFASRIGFIPMLRDVEDLARDTEWMNLLQEKATNFLEASGALVVGYAVGLGRTVHNGVVASAASIDLNAESEENTKWLSRVLPPPKSNTKFVCLPRQRNFTLYSDANYTPSLPGFFTQTAVHKCRNAFAQRRRDDEENDSESAIVYDMALINRGEVIASNQYNNVFLIHGGAATVTGSINTTNIYKLMNDTFHGGIIFQGKSNNTLDLSALESSGITFSWNVQWKMGSIRLNDSQETSFTVMTKNSHFLQLHVLGRAEKTEIYRCNDSKKHKTGTATPENFMIDGRGGTASKMDRVRDCKVTTIRPYTYVAGGNDRNATHLAYVPLRYAAPVLSPRIVRRKSVIDPRQSKFIVTFTDRPFLAATHKIKYIPRSATLSWEFSDTLLSTMILQIKSYRTPYLNVENDISDRESDMGMINCMFVDAVTNSIIYPKLNLLGNETNTVSVRHLNVLTWINSTRLADVVSYYRKIKADVAGAFIVHKLIDYMTGRSFLFGSRASDRFYVDANTTFIYGDDGSDIYSFNSLSSECVWLDNRAQDTATDTIVLSDGMCSSLVTDIGSDDTQDIHGSLDDITLTCLTAPSAVLPHRKIVLRDYRVDASSRHLQIYWKDSLYVPVIYKQQEQFYMEDSFSVCLALAFSFDDWTATMLTPTHEDSCIVVKMSDDVTNPLVAYKSQSNMILTRKHSNNFSPSFILLEDYFTHNGSISQWSNLTVFVVDDELDAIDRARVLHAHDLQGLLVDTENPKLEDFIKEYFVDMAINNKTVVIDHNNESTVYKKLGILRLLNIVPGDVKATWSATTASLQLCAQNSCVEVRHWCDLPSSRLYRIDFEVSLDRTPTVIRGLDKLQCQEAKNNSTQDTLIGKLNEMLSKAQRVLQLSEENEESDQSQLINCLGINLAKTVVKSSIYELFGFATEFEEMYFVQSNCQALYSPDRLDQLTLESFRTALGIKLEKYLVFNSTNDVQSSIENFRSHLETLDNISWKKYLTAVRD